MTRKTSRNLLILITIGALGGCAVAADEDAPELAQKSGETMCPAIYAPVCDADGRIYSSACVAAGEGAEVDPNCTVVDLEEPIETPHPYGNNERRAWPIAAPGLATRILIEFDSFELEHGYDHVRLFSGSGEQVQSLTGNLGRFMSEPIEGHEANIVFNSDGSVTADGFHVRRYVYFMPCVCPTVWAPVCGADGQTYGNGCEARCINMDIAFVGECRDHDWYEMPNVIESDHDYANNEDQTWWVTEGGSSIRLHFETIDLEEGYDFLHILDGDEEVVTSYTGSHSDIFTPVVAGGRIGVRLVTDYSVTSWGFRADAYGVHGGCYSDLDCDEGTTCVQVQCFRAPCFRACVRDTPECPLYMPPGPDFCTGGIIVPRTDGMGCQLPPRCERQEGAYCAGSGGWVCDDGFWCDVSDGAGEEDICSLVARQGVCQPEGECTTEYVPVCGCDGETYHNDCRRLEAGVALDHAGTCSIGCRVPSDCGAPLLDDCDGEWACMAGSCEYHCSHHVFGRDDMALDIPDQGTVSSEVDPSDVGVIESLRVSVDISHTWRGDLGVELTNGVTTVTLVEPSSGDSADGIILEDVVVTDFDGQLGEGEWFLRVTDNARYDVGTLNSWSIDFN